ncbi:hypothetical protein KC356_g8026 [Hortaea werneckii]|nr:hypothetical protein KC356_g8026 [Hortaea werneckii]
MAPFPDGALEWCYALPQIQFVLNDALSTALGTSPNEMALGFRPREPVDVSGCKSLAEVEQQGDVLRRNAADSVAYAQVVMKARYDAAHLPWKPQFGGLVFLRLQNYMIPGVRNKKLSPPRVGLFPIKSLTSTGLACKLDLLSHWKIHPVVSNSRVGTLAS